MTRDVRSDLLGHLTVECIQMTALQRACSKVKAWDSKGMVEFRDTYSGLRLSITSGILLS